jgi:hypothetical protein
MLPRSIISNNSTEYYHMAGVPAQALHRQQQKSNAASVVELPTVISTQWRDKAYVSAFIALVPLPCSTSSANMVL